jgi:uncharacterized protein (DUF58 family)
MVYFIMTFCLLASSFIQRVNLLVLLFGMLLAFGFFSVLQAWRNIAGFSASREVPTEVFADEPSVLGIKLVRSGVRRTALAVVVEDHLQGVNGPPLKTAFVSVPAEQTVQGNIFIGALARGRYRLGPIVVTSRFPLGLVECRCRIQVPDEVLIVFPALGELTTHWRRANGSIAHASRRFQPISDRSQEEFHGVREYRSGDNPRHIHWRSTARRGQIVVKEFEALLARDTVIVVDASCRDKIPPAACEKVLSFAATALVDLCHRNATAGTRVTVIIAGTHLKIVKGIASRRLLSEALTALADVDIHQPDLSNRLPSNLMPGDFQNAMIWVLSNSTKPPITTRLAPLIGPRSSQNIQLVDVMSPECGTYFHEKKASVRNHEWSDDGEPGRNR